MSLTSEPFNLGAFFDISLLWKVALVFIILNNLKCLPLVWHVRLLKGFRFVLRSNRYKNGPTPEQLFQPLIISSGGSLMEMDYNLHKSNSTYFADLDIARCHLMCTLFARGIDHARNTKSLGLLGNANGMVGLALGAVSCTFRREVKPCQRYEIWTRVLTWDQKWMYVVTHFVRKDAIQPRSFTLLPGQVPRQGKLKDLAKKEDAIFASALSKCVWKKGRRTIPPELMLQASGLLPARPDQEDFFATLPEEPLVKLKLSRQAEEVYDIPFKMADKIETTCDALAAYFFSSESDVSEAGLSAGPKEMCQSAQDGWTWERVERERQRGMEIAKSLAELDRLDGEFTAEAEALGLRRDLW